MTGFFVLRPVEPGDEAFLLGLYASTREQEMALVPWPEEEKRAFIQMQFQAQHKYYQEAFPDAQFSLILRDGRPAGRLYMERRADEHRIIDIALLPEYRGQGLGSGLMNDILTEAGAAGKPVRIHVERNNPALSLYSRLGFRQVEDQGVYHLMEWRPEGYRRI